MQGAGVTRNKVSGKRRPEEMRGTMEQAEVQLGERSALGEELNAKQGLNTLCVTTCMS